jgi:hypothetical protein
MPRPPRRPRASCMIRNMTLTCDHPGCTSRIPLFGGVRTRARRQTRQDALRQGWARDADGRDFCPDHAVEATGGPGTGPGTPDGR